MIEPHKIRSLDKFAPTNKTYTYSESGRALFSRTRPRYPSEIMTIQPPLLRTFRRPSCAKLSTLFTRADHETRVRPNDEELSF